MDLALPHRHVARRIPRSGRSSGGFSASTTPPIFTLAEFVPPDVPVARVAIIPPAIDPLSPKNLPAAADHGATGPRVDRRPHRRPLVTQVSRFDRWKDPLGVVEAYRACARQESRTSSSRSSARWRSTIPRAGTSTARSAARPRTTSRIHVFTNLVGVGNIEVNAFQRLSNVVIQKSIREGFGLVVSEALWKGTPVVAGRAGGIPLQMADGVGGILVDSVEECAAAISSWCSTRRARKSWDAAATNESTSTSCCRGCF